MKPTCPDCGSSTISEYEFVDSSNPEAGFMYAKVFCENSHEYGLELEVVTVLE